MAAPEARHAAATTLALLLLAGGAPAAAPGAPPGPPPAPAVAADEGDDLAVVIDGLARRELHDMVVRESESFLKRFAEHPRAHVVRYRLASALYALDRLEDAATHYKQLAGAEGFPWRAEAALRLAQCEMAAGRPERAALALDVALTLDVEYLKVPATFLLGEAAFEMERWDEAAGHYEEVLRLDPKGEYAGDAALALVWCAHRLGHEEAVVKRTEELLHREQPAARRAELLFLRGEALAQLGRPSEALPAYEAVEEGPLADAALRGRAFALADLGDNAGSATLFAQLLQRFPESRFVPEAALQLGVQRLLAGDAEKAHDALADSAVPDSGEAAYWRARAHAARGEDEQALALLKRAEKDLPEDDPLRPAIAATRGQLLASAGRADEAAQAFLSVGGAQGRHAAAVAQLNAGDAEGALELLAPLLEQQPDDAALRLTRAEALFALERYDEAEGSYEAALKNGTPEMRPRARARLAWCRFAQDDAAGAARLFEEVLQRHPEAPEAEEAQYMLGRCQATLGQQDEARRSFARYLEKHPEGSRRNEAWLGLAAASEGSEAQEALSSLLQEAPDSEAAARASFDLAEMLAGAGELSAAEQHYRDFLQRFPQHPRTAAARYGLAWCLAEDGRHDEAATELDTIAAAPRAGNGASAPAPPDSQLTIAALELLVWCRHQLGDAKAAEAAFGRLQATEATPDSLLSSARTVAATWVAAEQPDRARRVLEQLGDHPVVGAGAQVEAAWLALDAGDVAGAEKRVKAALERAPDDADVAECAFFVAEARFAAGEDEAALPLYAAAANAKDSPVPDQALYKEGFARLRMGDHTGAEVALMRLLSQHPKSELAGESLFLAGEAAFRDERWKDAAGHMARLVEQHPRHEVLPKARFRLGLALAHLQRWDQAEHALSDLARTSPDFPNLLEAELWRGRALSHLGSERAARAAWQRVVDGDQGVLAAQARLEMGRLQLQGGDVEGALSEFLKVALLYAHDEEVAEALLLAGECLERLGDTARARDRYQEIVDQHPETRVADAARRRLQAL